MRLINLTFHSLCVCDITLWQRFEFWRQIQGHITRDLTGKDTVKSAFRSERRQVSDMLKSVSKQEAPNFLCWHCFSDLKADFTVSFPVSSLSIHSPTWYLVMSVYLAYTITMGAENWPLNVSSRVTDKYRKRIVSISVLHVYGHKELLCCFTRTVITLYSCRREDALLARYGITRYHSICL